MGSLGDRMKKYEIPFDAVLPPRMPIIIRSDEISILLVYYQRLESEPWFGNRTNKIISFAVSQAASFFNQPNFRARDTFASFDARIFVLPREDVENYFIWRWKDWVRNSLSMLARAHFSHKELMDKKREDMHEMLHSKGINWADCDDHIKNGTIVHKEYVEDTFYWHLEAAPRDLDGWRELIKPLVNPEAG